MQHTATHCNTLQHNATHCNTLQHTATQCNTLQHTATHCNTLHHTAAHCITLNHTATHCNTLQHTATNCNTQCSTFIPPTHIFCPHKYRILGAGNVKSCSQYPDSVSPFRLHHTASHCITLHHTAAHCITLQHTATHCNAQCNTRIPYPLFAQLLGVGHCEREILFLIPS